MCGVLGGNSGELIVDPDGRGGIEPTLVHCEMELAGGGWSRVVRMTSGANFWNAWNDLPEAQDGLVGHPISAFSASETGEDLEYLIVVDGEPLPYLYTGINGSLAWNPNYNETLNREFSQPHQHRLLDGDNYELCDGGVHHQSNSWEWSFATGEGGGCSHYTNRGWVLQDTFIEGPPIGRRNFEVFEAYVRTR